MTLKEADHQALARLSALAHEVRLQIMQHLMASYPESVAAGELSSMLDVPPNAASFHLKEMTSAGLIESERDGRFILYRAVPSVVEELRLFLGSLQASMPVR